jgi:hypothetical protein
MEDLPTEELNKLQKKLSHLDSKKSITVLISKMFNQGQFKEAS